MSINKVDTIIFNRNRDSRGAISKVPMTFFFLIQKFKRSSTISDIRGRKLCAMKVFTCAIRYFMDHLLEELKRRNVRFFNLDEIQWVLTVPTIWNDEAKTFMREAAIQVYITKIIKI